MRFVWLGVREQTRQMLAKSKVRSAKGNSNLWLPSFALTNRILYRRFFVFWPIHTSTEQAALNWGYLVSYEKSLWVPAWKRRYPIIHFTQRIPKAFLTDHLLRATTAIFQTKPTLTSFAVLFSENVTHLHLTVLCLRTISSKTLHPTPHKGKRLLGI